MMRRFVLITTVLFCLAANGAVSSPFKQGIPPQNPLPASTPPAVNTPSPGPEGSYRLKDWTVTDAQKTMDQVNNALSDMEDDPQYVGAYGYSAYLSLYNILAQVESEALLKFPQASQAEKWRWDICYNRRDVICYRDLLEEGLNTGQVKLADLTAWFTGHESRLSFEIYPLSPPLGYIRSAIIILNKNACLWLLEKKGKFQVEEIYSAFTYPRDSWVSYQMIELTGDSYPELVLLFSHEYCCGSMSDYFIYEISSGSVVPLSFLTPNGTLKNLNSESESTISKLDAGTPPPGFLYTQTYGDPSRSSCPLWQKYKYDWNGTAFEVVETWKEVGEPGEYDDRTLCQFALDITSDPGEVDVVVETLYKQGDASPEEMRDQIRYRLGEYQARSGNVDRALRYFQDLVAAPASVDPSGSVWVKNAQKFITAANLESDFYGACSKIDTCDLQKAFEQVVAEIPVNAFPLVPDKLKKSGVTVQAAGAFDFNKIGTSEQWVLIRPPRQDEAEFWIITRQKQAIHALFVAGVPSDAGTPDFGAYRLDENYWYALKSTGGDILYSLAYMKFNRQLVIYSRPFHQIDETDQSTADANIFSSARSSIYADLLSGSDPAPLREALIRLKDKLPEWDAPEYYYYLGLSNELMGDDQAALEAYLQLWKLFPDDLYTIVGRSKLAVK